MGQIHSCKNIFDDIVMLGGKVRKSLDIDFPVVPRKFLPDFVRGYFDGDGCIYLDKRRNRYYSSFSCGSKEFIEKLYAVLKKYLDIGGYIRKRSCKYKEKKGIQFSKDSTWYEINLKYNDTKKLGCFIYSTNDALRLERKYERFAKII